MTIRESPAQGNRVPPPSHPRHADVRITFSMEALSFSGENSPMAALVRAIETAVAEFERAVDLGRAPVRPGNPLPEPVSAQEDETGPAAGTKAGAGAASDISTDIVTARRSIKYLIGTRLSALDITPNLYWLIRILFHNVAASVGELAREMRLDVPTVSRMVKQMVFRGYLAAEKDPANRRNTLVRLTPEGESLCGELNQIEADFQGNAEKGILAEEVAVMQKVLSKYIANLDRMVATDASELPGPARSGQESSEDRALV